MKIAIALNGKEKDSGVCGAFGRAPYFLIYDSKDGSSQVFENEAANSSGGAGVKAASYIADNSQVLIAERLGQNAAIVMEKAGVKIYKNISDNVDENIKAYLEGKLEELTDIHQGYHR